MVITSNIKTLFYEIVDGLCLIVSFLLETWEKWQKSIFVGLFFHKTPTPLPNWSKLLMSLPSIVRSSFWYYWVTFLNFIILYTSWLHFLDKQASLIGHLEQQHLLGPKTTFLEFGAGRGQFPPKINSITVKNVVWQLQHVSFVDSPFLSVVLFTIFSNVQGGSNFWLCGWSHVL